MFLCGHSFPCVFDKCPSFTNTLPSLALRISGCAPALRHISLCKTLHYKCSTVFWIRLCLDNYSVICTVTIDALYCIRHIQNSVFSEIWRIFNYIQRYEGIFTHIKTLLRYIHIQTYSGIFSTLWNLRILWPCHILSPDIFWTGDYLKPCKTLTRHIPNPVTGHY